MKTQTNIQASSTPISIFWVLDGFRKVDDQRSLIKKLGAYYEKDHKTHCVDSPSEETRKAIFDNGMKLQFRKSKWVQ